MVNNASCCGSLTGIDFSIITSIIVKMALFAPIPRANENRAINVNAGLRRNIRTPYRRSCQNVSISYSSEAKNRTSHRLDILERVGAVADADQTLSQSGSITRRSFWQLKN